LAWAADNIIRSCSLKLGVFSTTGAGRGLGHGRGREQAGDRRRLEKARQDAGNHGEQDGEDEQQDEMGHGFLQVVRTKMDRFRRNCPPGR
jgi:hypothetical protein